ncbi:MAG: NAD(P)H-dependent oxidoreductase subunit E, partial [Clostridiales bacterium]|nr:NAD(P)H-dependent oxidoreductase subunit E [Clostridiales bacterium]
MTIEELNKIKKAGEELVLVRRVVQEQGEELAKKTGFRKQVLVCGGTGCTSSGSKKVIAALENALVKNGIEKEILVVKTGCFGLCALGSIMIVYPEGCFYSQVTPEGVERIVEEHLKNNNIVKELLYAETVHEDGSIISLNETRFYKKQMRVALRNCGVIDPENIEEYIASDGYQALAKVLTSMTGQDVIDELTKSGLRGRG